MKLRTFRFRRTCGRRLQVAFLAFFILALLSFLAIGLLLPDNCDWHRGWCGLQHYRYSRNLTSYINEFSTIIEPTPTEICNGVIPLVVTVTTVANHLAHRNAIRETWGTKQPTFFFIGLPAEDTADQMVDIHVEARHYGDIVVCDVIDSYQNLTLKTACMIHWVMRRCPRAIHMLKTDDDMMVNLWTLEEVIRDQGENNIFGYLIEGVHPHRSPYSKYYLPEWLYPEEDIPQYLTGGAYIIRGDKLRSLFEAATSVNLVNLEDIYLSYLVAKKALNWTLSHDRRVNSFTPVLATSCMYWSLATAHGFDPDDQISVWAALKDLAERSTRGEEVCRTFNKFLYIFNSWFI